MNEPFITVVGNVAGDVDLRYSPNGVAVANWSVASTPRDKDRNTGEYVDGETLWVRCTAFKSDAENAAESLVKGTRVMVTGRLRQESWTDKEDNKRTSMKLLVDEVAVSAKWAVVTARKADRSGGSSRPASSGPAADPWSTSADTDENIPF